MSKNSPPQNTSTQVKKRKLSFNEQRELDSMESNIHKAEKRLAELTQESSDPEVVSNAIKLSQISAEMAEVQAKVDMLYKRWEELEQTVS